MASQNNTSTGVNIHNVTVSAQVTDTQSSSVAQGDDGASSDSSNSTDNMQQQLKTLREKLSTLSKDFEAYTCCAKPFDAQLALHIESRIKQRSLIKRL